MTSGLAETRRPTTVPVFALMTVARAASKIAAIIAERNAFAPARSANECDLVSLATRQSARDPPDGQTVIRP